MRTLPVGDYLIFAVEHRGGDEGGPSLHMIVRMPADPPHQETRRFQQLWRADCFKVKPHEHLFGPAREVTRDFPALEAGDPVDWCLRRLEWFPGIVEEAGYPELARSMRLYKPAPDTYINTLAQWLQETAIT